MKSIWIVLLALLSLFGVAGAIDSVEIVRPTDNQEFNVSEKVSMWLTYTDLDGNADYRSMLFVDSLPSPTSRPSFNEPGEHWLAVIVFDKFDHTITTDSVVINVVGDDGKNKK